MSYVRHIGKLPPPFTLHPPPSTLHPPPAAADIIFCPNRLYPFETHGHYWRGQYHFGNTPFVNWLPDPLRDRLAPHVRAYTKAGLVEVFEGLPVRGAP